MDLGNKYARLPRGLCAQREPTYVCPCGGFISNNRFFFDCVCVFVYARTTAVRARAYLYVLVSRSVHNVVLPPAVLIGWWCFAFDGGVGCFFCVFGLVLFNACAALVQLCVHRWAVMFSVEFV